MVVKCLFNIVFLSLQKESVKRLKIILIHAHVKDILGSVISLRNPVHRGSPMYHV